MTQASVGTEEQIFELLDKWRHFAAYQLEPRTDVFFGMFLPMVIEERLGVEIKPTLVPQFPLKTPSNNNHCYRVDYFAVSKSGEKGFLIEIKTDMGSRRGKQDKYLKKAVKKGMGQILCDVNEVSKVRDKGNRKKYFHILHALSQIDIITLPENLKEVMYSDQSWGVFDLIDKIELCREDINLSVIYVQPERHESTCDGADDKVTYVCFECFANSIKDQGKLGGLFASYLRKWIKPAGERRPL